MADALTARFDLPADFRAAGRARRIITELLTAWGRQEDAEVARLLVSEVVTNAVRHAGQGQPLELTVTADDGRVRVAVGDSSAQQPTPRAARDDEESGRGMRLIASLASQWGVSPPADPAAPVSKEVWFELPVTNGRGPAEPSSDRPRVRAGRGQITAPDGDGAPPGPAEP